MGWQGFSKASEYNRDPEQKPERPQFNLSTETRLQKLEAAVLMLADELRKLRSDMNSATDPRNFGPYQGHGQ